MDSLLRQPCGDNMFMAENIKSMKEDFVDFDSAEYDQDIPSTSYLLPRVVTYMEPNSKYKRKRMQMMDGRHLSGDHSFKLTKCVLAGGSKPFSAMYCIMNEFGQVIAWWFTTVTGMRELEDSVKKLRE